MDDKTLLLIYFAFHISSRLAFFYLFFPSTTEEVTKYYEQHVLEYPRICYSHIGKQY